MKKNAFTLVELLAVIVILSIIAAIATIFTINVINESKNKSFINSVYGLIDGTRLLSAEQMLVSSSNRLIVKFTDGSSSNENFRVSGDMPDSGNIYLNSDGKIELKVWSEELGKCAEKSANESEVRITDTTKENCKVVVGKSFSEVMEPLIGTEVNNNDPDGNLRYVGSAPNNYVWFNKDDNGMPEKWRIIGIFDGYVKIIRNDYYSTGIAWDEADENASYSDNWATASLNVLFNDVNTGYIKTIETNDPVSYGYIDLEHVWNTGGIPSGSGNYVRESVYNYERGTAPAGVSGAEATWTGAIGLMYASDYGYSTSGVATTCDKTMYSWDSGSYKTECAKKSWLYDSKSNQWTFTPRSDHESPVCGVSTTGFVRTRNAVASDFAARPVLYLKSDTRIIDGQGTFEEPFELTQ